MGQQIHIKTSDLLKAGCKVEFTSTSFADEDEGYFTQAKVTCPDGQSFYMSYCDLDNTNLLSNDYNQWGSNYNVINPKITKFNIPHIVS